jgi:hypothetical protein
MRSHQQPNKRPRRGLSLSVESLEGRALLSVLPLSRSSYPGYPPSSPSPTPTPTPSPTTTPTPTPTPTPSPSATPPPAQTLAPPGTLATSVYAPTPPPAAPPRGHAHHSHALHATATGVATKAPAFYPFYTGPQLPELNAVKTTGKLVGHHTFVFTGTNQGRIDQAPAVYVWGVDRSGNLSAGPFTDRPNITFDAVVIVRLDSSLTPTTEIMDLDTGTTTTLPTSAAHIHGATVTVKVPASLLPSTGLPLAQYRFNYWPEDGGPPISSSVASFLPESNDIQVGVSGHR